MQQVPRKNPIEKDRDCTDIAFIIVFLTIFFTWFIILTKVPHDDPLTELSDLFKIFDSITARFYERVTWTFFLLTIPSVFISVVYTWFFSRSFGRFLVSASACLIFVWMLFVIAITVVVVTTTELINLDIPQSVILCIFSFTYAVHLFLCGCVARRVGNKTIFEIINAASRMIINNPAILLFALAMSVLSFVIFLGENYLLTYVILYRSNNDFYYTFIFHGGLAFISFISNFTSTVMYGCIIDCFWKQDDNLESLTIWRSIKTTFCYHTGTVVFASMPLLPQICSIYHLYRRRINNNDKKKYNVITRFFSQFNLCLFVSEFALVQTAIYGYDFSTAVMVTQDLVAKDNHQIYLAVSQVSMVVFGIGCFLLLTPFMFVNTYAGFYCMVLPFCMVFINAVEALLVNKMIINYHSDSVQQDHDGGKKAAVPLSQISA